MKKRFKHRWTAGLECDLVDIEKRGKQLVCVAVIGEMIIRQNKEIFYNEWIEIKDSKK